MNRIEIINGLIAKNNYKRYLEIGVRDGSCFNAINCEHKVGVDPDKSSAATHYITSDQFFALTDEGPMKFDIIFIDGLHHSDQVTKDIINALQHLSPGGTIVMHDCLPTNEFMQLIPMRPDHNEWTGDTWRAYLYFRMFDENLEMCVVDTDWGCGIIRPGKQMCLSLASTHPDAQITYQDFERHKHQWMNVVSVEEFKRRYL